MRALLDERSRAQLTVEVTNRLFEERGISREQWLENLPPTTCYVMEVSLSQIPDRDARERLMNLPTSFALERAHVDELIEWGRKLVREHGVLRDFVASQGP